MHFNRLLMFTATPILTLRKNTCVIQYPLSRALNTIKASQTKKKLSDQHFGQLYSDSSQLHIDL